MNRRKLIILFFCLIITTQFFQTMNASQYNPNGFFLKPFKDLPYHTNASISFSAGSANTAFDRNGKTVPFLQQYGPEDFLERFVNPSIGLDNLESAGQGHISGIYQFKQYRFAYGHNIFHQLVFGTVFAIQDISITNINAKFIESEYPLSSNQINYLDKLNQSIPNTINQSGLFTATLYLGYNEKLINFNHIESLHVLLLAGISTPQSMENKNFSVLQHPCSANIHFGYPVTTSINAHVRNWFSCGFSGLVAAFQPVTVTIPINKTSENNFLLFSQSTQAKIDQAPFFAATLYAELKNPARGLVGTIAYNYSSYLGSKITPIDLTQFPAAHANKSIALDGYSLGAILLQLDIDSSKNNNKVAPLVSFFVSIPIVGKLYQKTYLFGGSSTLQVSYIF